jgi:hypothetical protein
LAENFNVGFLADILPIFESGENRDQRRCLLVDVFGRNPTGRMRSATAAFLMPAGGQTGIRTRCKRCNAAEGLVARLGGIVIYPVNTGDLVVFRLIGRPAAKTARSRRNRRLLTWTFLWFV